VSCPTDGRDDDWVSELITLWGDPIVRFAHMYTGNADLAQDVAQETFARLLVWRRKYPGRAFRPGWLFAVARNVAADILRRTPDRSGGEPRRLDSSGEVVTRLSVQETLRQLPAKDRECLVLFYFADWPIAKIALHTRTTPAAVKMRLKRARERFRASWGGEN
jgi:RNA polymerase sigma-70 factor (ECF subfamily)